MTSTGLWQWRRREGDRPGTHFGGKANDTVAGLDVTGKEHVFVVFVLPCFVLFLAGTSVWSKYDKICQSLGIRSRGTRVLSSPLR